MPRPVAKRSSRRIISTTNIPVGVGDSSRRNMRLLHPTEGGSASIPNRNPLLDPKMLFDRGDALKRVINFLSVSGDVGHARFHFFDIAPNIRDFRAEDAKVLRCLFAEFRELVLCRQFLTT